MIGESVKPHADNNEVKPVAYWVNLLAISGFVAVAFAQVSNMILARANAGEVPPFSLACVRWTVIALGLSPFLIKSFQRSDFAKPLQWWPVFAAGFMGMFLCGAPVYIAAVSTTAINIALIMSLSPIVVLIISWLAGLEEIGRLQLLGVGLALLGALFIILRAGGPALSDSAALWADLLMVAAMFGWSGYTLLQSRAGPHLPFLGRVSLFAAVGALTSLPVAIQEAIVTPQRVFSWHALAMYLFAGVVPGILAYGGFAYLGSKFGSIRASLVLYVGPVASALLSFLLLGEPPGLVHLYGGAFILAGVWLCLRK